MSKENLLIEKFISTVTKITERPGMYAINRVEDIEYIFIGYSFAITNSFEENILINYLESFRLFVNKWSELGNNANWGRSIRFHSSTDKHSLELFSKLFLAFIANAGHSISSDGAPK